MGPFHFAFLFVCMASAWVFASDRDTSQYADLAEYPIQWIPLPAPLKESAAQMSGLSWCNDQLVFLPQFPEFAASGKGEYLYSIKDTDLVHYLDSDQGRGKTPEVQKLQLIENGLRDKIKGFDGYEGIACHADNVWFVIEVDGAENQSHSYIVPASFHGGIFELISSKAVFIRSQSGFPNTADESILLKSKDVLTIHELNSHDYVRRPFAHLYSTETNKFNRLSLPNIPYRITDVTSLDESGKFWAINYFFEGDDFMRQDEDVLFERFGAGITHRMADRVERLLEFQITSDQIKLSGNAPIQLRLSGKAGRNWEGIARLEDRGLLLVTDEYPTTYFGFVAFPKPLNNKAENTRAESLTSEVGK